MLRDKTFLPVQGVLNKTTLYEEVTQKLRKQFERVFRMIFNGLITEPPVHDVAVHK